MIKDLRVGNLIADHECEPYYFVVEEIKKNEQGNLAVYYRNGSCMTTEPELVKLTEDWHKKFGSEKNGFGNFEYNISDRKKIVSSGDYIYIRDIALFSGNESMDDDICVLWNNDEKRRGIFVHEFQNLYSAISGNELTLTTPTP